MVLKPCGGGKGEAVGVRVVKGKKSGRGKDAGARLQECSRCGKQWPIGEKHP